MNVIIFCKAIVGIMVVAVVLYMGFTKNVLDFLGIFIKSLSRRQSTVVKVREKFLWVNTIKCGEYSLFPPRERLMFIFILLENGEKIYIPEEEVAKKIKVGDTINYKMFPTRKSCTSFRRAREVWPVKRILQVALAIVIRDNKVLVERRAVGKNYGSLWEFPGGEVESGETPAQAVVREMMEKLCCRVIPQKLLINEVSVGKEKIYSLSAVLVESPDKVISPGFAHSEMMWAGIKEFRQLNFVPHSKKIFDYLIRNELLR